MKSLLAALVLALLAGCAAGPQIDHTYKAIGQSPRVKFVVIHYTVSDKPSSINILTTHQVSAHYLLTDDPKPVIYGLVDESQQAWHAGVSSWKGFTMLNTSSVGIEIVNPGWKDTPQGRVYAPFPKSQIDTLIVLLKDIVKRNHVAPENILGHEEIAPQRKQDPGPMFPWYRLAQEGLIAWPDANRVAAVRPVFEAQLPDVDWFQQKLAKHGYGIEHTCVLDEQTRNVLSAFQAKFRPANIDGNPDAETAALLEVLTTPPGTPLPVVQPVPAPAVPGAPAAPATPAAPANPACPAACPAVPGSACPATPAAPASPAAPAVPASAAPATPAAPAVPAAPASPALPVTSAPATTAAPATAATPAAAAGAPGTSLAAIPATPAVAKKQ